MAIFMADTSLDISFPSFSNEGSILEARSLLKALVVRKYL